MLSVEGYFWSICQTLNLEYLSEFELLDYLEVIFFFFGVSILDLNAVSLGNYLELLNLFRFDLPQSHILFSKDIDGNFP